MDTSQYAYSALDELRYIQFEARQSTSLDDLRHYFERVQALRRANIDDFDLQLFIAEIQEQIIDRARALREEAAPVLVNDGGAGSARHRFTPSDGESADTQTIEPSPDVHRIDPKSWQRAIYLALFFTFIICAAGFYLIQAARKLNFPNESAAPGARATQQSTGAKNGAPQNPPNAPAPVPMQPTLRLYTDLVPGTVAIDGNQPQDLKDGELVLDKLEPGEHSIKISGRSGNAVFSYDVDPNAPPRVVGSPSASNAMAVLVSTHNGEARLLTNADDSQVLLDGKSAGQVAPDGLTLQGLGNSDHEIQVTQGKDRQRFVLTYTPAPTLTAYVKSDPNTGTVVLVTGQDGADVFINGRVYQRKTDRGQLRIPNLAVGEYTIRVHETGFIDPPPQTVHVKKAEETAVEFHLQPVPAIARLQIKGALSGTMVYLDDELAAAIGADGVADISNVKAGDHTIELRRDQALAKRFQHVFRTGEVFVLSGPDVTLEQAVVESKPEPEPPPPAPNPAPGLANNSMQMDGEQVRKGGGFVPYHIPKLPGHYYFTAQARKGGFLKHGKLQWYAGYQDSENYILFTVDNKHASIHEVRDGKSTEITRMPFNLDSNEWVQVDLSVRPNAIEVQLKSTDTGWNELGIVSSPGWDFTQGKVGFYIPGSDEIAVSNFRFSAR